MGRTEDHLRTAQSHWSTTLSTDTPWQHDRMRLGNNEEMEHKGDDDDETLEEDEPGTRRTDEPHRPAKRRRRRRAPASSEDEDEDEDEDDRSRSQPVARSRMRRMLRRRPPPEPPPDLPGSERFGRPQKRLRTIPRRLKRNYSEAMPAATTRRTRRRKAMESFELSNPITSYFFNPKSNNS